MFKAMWSILADDSRRAVLDLLRQKPHTVNELSAALTLSQPSTSKHLKTLREAGLVTVTIDAQRRIYALDPLPLQALEAWLAPYRALWNTALDDLEHYLESE